MEENNFIQVFTEEAHELLGSLEDYLLELESNPTDEYLISAVFRVMHTIKGSAGMVGLCIISNFTHKVETILELIRSGKAKVSKGFIDYTLKSRDIILQMIDDPDYSLENEEDFFKAFNNLISNNTTLKNEDLIPITYRIIFKPEAKIFFTGTNPIMMVNEVLELGEGIVIPNYSLIPKISNFESELCYTSWEIFITTTKNINAIHDIFIFVQDSSTILIEEWDFGNSESYPEKLGEYLVKTGNLDSSELEKALKNQHRLGEILVNEKLVSEQDVKNALKAQEFINNSKKNKNERKNESEDSIRIKSNKLDSLIDLVGEIVTVYAQMSQTSKELKNSKLISIIERFGMLTEELRDNAMGMRMLQIGSTFSRFRRVVRDLSAELGKKIELVTVGEETELDKNVIEQLQDPLIHIIRNCIDHGIELPEVRKNANKKELGTIKLTAIHAGATINIVIEDNGGGLNRDKILKKAIAKGILSENEQISDDKILNLIFSPGFSTADSITNISGRGVGLDVVKQKIESLKGTVTIESEEGISTKITLILPITLAIIEGLSVKISDEVFVIPLGAVEACVELKNDDKSKSVNKKVINFRDKLVPYIDLRKFFEITGTRKNIEQIVIVNANNSQIGLLVDSVIGSDQTVIKSLSTIYENIKEISGATIMGNGNVALVLDIEQLVKVAELQE